MYYWILKINVFRDIRACLAFFIYRFCLFFAGKRQRKSTKNLTKTCHGKRIFVIWSYCMQTLRHVGMRARKAGEHVSTQDTWTHNAHNLADSFGSHFRSIFTASAASSNLRKKLHLRYLTWFWIRLCSHCFCKKDF